MKRSRIAIIGLIVAAFLLMAVLCQYWSPLVLLADAHSGLASWVQAFGAIVAILAAFLIANLQATAQRRDASEQTAAQLREKKARDRAKAVVVAAGLVEPITNLSYAFDAIALKASPEWDGGTFDANALLEQLNKPKYPSYKELLHLAPVTPAAAVAYAKAFHARTELIERLQTNRVHPILGKPTPILARESMKVVATDGANQCTVAVRELLELLATSKPPIDQHRNKAD